MMLLAQGLMTYICLQLAVLFSAGYCSMLELHLIQGWLVQHL